jgi:predicted secreted Zn-dependent protease
MSVNNIDDSLGTSSRGYLKTTKFNTGSIRLLFISAVYFYLFISAQGQLVDKIKYYDIKGDTAREFTQNWLRIQNELGFAGYCLWQPKMSHSYTHNSFGFRASNLNLKVHVTLTLPRIYLPEDMPSQTRDFYIRQVREIYAHENVHRQFKIQFYNEFLKDYNRLRSYSTTHQLYDETNKLLWKHYNQTKAKDARFDANGHR